MAIAIAIVAIAMVVTCLVGNEAVCSSCYGHGRAKILLVGEDLLQVLSLSERRLLITIILKVIVIMLIFRLLQPIIGGTLLQVLLLLRYVHFLYKNEK